MSEAAIVVDYVLPDLLHSHSAQKPVMPSYALAVLSGMTPPRLLGCDVVTRVHDERARGPYDPERAAPDILCLSYPTSTARRAFALGDHALRSRSHNGRTIKVVHGGPHATSLPSEALCHASMVVRGEVTPAFLERLLSRAFRMETAEREIARLAAPPATLDRPAVDWSWMNPRDYLAAPTAQTSTGCPFDCDFCSVTPVFGQAMRPVPLENLRTELRPLKPRSLVVIVDDNFLQGIQPRHVDHCIRVASLMKELQLQWLVEVTTRTLMDAQEKLAEERPGFDLIQFFAECGCRGMYFGIETIAEDRAGLSKARGNDKIVRLIRHCQACGIGVLGAFVIGLSRMETPAYADQLLEFAIQTARLDVVQFSINTPMPGSPNFLAAVAEDAISNYNWDLYNGGYSVQHHPTLSAVDLREMLLKLYREFYSGQSIIDRYSQALFSISKNVWRRIGAGIPINIGLLGSNCGVHERIEDAPSHDVLRRPHPAVLRDIEIARRNPFRGRISLFDIRNPRDGISCLVHA